MLIGILPTLTERHLVADNLSTNERYRVLNDQIVGARGEDIELDIRGVERLQTHTDSIAPEAACTSLQFHLQVAPDSFADYWNASQAIAGVQVAIGANSPFLYGRQLWAETRIALFEQATDTRPDELKAQGVRPRVWFGERWITSIFDLFEENVRYFPPLLPICEDEDPVEVLHAGGVPELGELRLHNGTVYRWNRPVYDIMNGRPHLRVENRVLPAGPTVVDMLANAAFYFGLARGLAEADRPIWSQLTFSSAEENFHAAARRGMDAVLHWPRLGEVPVTELVLDVLLPKAAHGAGPVRRRPGRAGPAARHHRAALPYRPQRRGLADRGGLGGRAAPGHGPGRRAAPHAPALRRAAAQQRARAHLAGRLTAVRTASGAADPRRARASGARPEGAGSWSGVARRSRVSGAASGRCSGWAGRGRRRSRRVGPRPCGTSVGPRCERDARLGSRRGAPRRTPSASGAAGSASRRVRAAAPGRRAGPGRGARGRTGRAVPEPAGVGRLRPASVAPGRRRSAVRPRRRPSPVASALGRRRGGSRSRLGPVVRLGGALPGQRHPRPARARRSARWASAATRTEPPTPASTAYGAIRCAETCSAAIAASRGTASRYATATSSGPAAPEAAAPTRVRQPGGPPGGQRADHQRRSRAPAAPPASRSSPGSRTGSLSALICQMPSCAVVRPRPASTLSTTETTASSQSQPVVAIRLVAAARECSAQIATTTPTSRPTAAYPAATVCGEKVSGTRAARAGTATSSTVISAPTAGGDGQGEPPQRPVRLLVVDAPGPAAAARRRRPRPRRWRRSRWPRRGSPPRPPRPSAASAGVQLMMPRP